MLAEGGTLTLKTLGALLHGLSRLLANKAILLTRDIEEFVILFTHPNRSRIAKSRKLSILRANNLHYSQKCH